MATIMEKQQRMKRVQQKFKMRGLSLTLDAVKAVLNHLEEADLPDGEALDLLLAELDKISCKFTVSQGPWY
jgi:DNA polymerase epsilon subunit 2